MAGQPRVGTAASSKRTIGVGPMPVGSPKHYGVFHSRPRAAPTGFRSGNRRVAMPTNDPVFPDTYTQFLSDVKDHVRGPGTGPTGREQRPH